MQLDPEAAVLLALREESLLLGERLLGQLGPQWSQLLRLARGRAQILYGLGGFIAAGFKRREVFSLSFFALFSVNLWLASGPVIFSGVGTCLSRQPQLLG